MARSFFVSAALILGLSYAPDALAQENAGDASRDTRSLVGGIWQGVIKDSKESMTMEFLAESKVELVFYKDGAEASRIAGTYKYDADSGKLAFDFDGKGFETKIAWVSSKEIVTTGSTGNQGRWLRKDKG